MQERGPLAGFRNQTLTTQLPSRQLQLRNALTVSPLTLYVPEPEAVPSQRLQAVKPDASANP